MRPKERLKPNTLVELSFCTVYFFFILFEITKCNLYIYIYQTILFQILKIYVFFSIFKKMMFFINGLPKYHFGMYLELFRLLFQTNTQSQWQTNINVRLALYREITLNSLYIEEPKKIAQKVKARKQIVITNLALYNLYSKTFFFIHFTEKKLIVTNTMTS